MEFSYSLIIAFILTGFIFTYFIWSFSIKRRAWKCCGHHVTFWSGLPIIGSLVVLGSLKNTEDLWNFVTECGSRYKKGLMLFLCHMPWLVLTELDVVETVLSSPECVEKAYIYKLLHPITRGVFVAQGSEWKKLRKKLNLTFSSRQLDYMYPDVNEQTAICINVLKKNTGKYINILYYMTTFFFDIIIRTHYGVESFEQRDREHQTTEAAAKVIELTLARRLFNPLTHINFLFAWTRFSEFIKHFRKMRLLFIQQLIMKRMTQLEKEKDHQDHHEAFDEKKRIYYLDLIKEVLEESNENPTSCRMESLTADVLVAATDTTAVGVSSIFFYLAYYPDIQEKVYQEVLSIYGDQTIKELTREDLNKMEYLEMVIKETLRLTAPAGIVRELKKEFDVGKYIIPKGTNVYIALRSIHMNPEYYEKADKFFPEHFTPERIRKRPKYAYLPLSQGPRNCPGISYSNITMKSIISSVVRNFKLETKTRLEDITYKMVLMQEQTNGYFIKLTPRF